MFDLLSLAARRHVLVAYREHIDPDDADLIFWLFHCGANFPEGPIEPEIRVHGQRRWQDAEQFLEILDNARADKTKAAIVQEVFAALKDGAPGVSLVTKRRYPKVFDLNELPNADRLASLARRVVAASCSSFLEGLTEKAARSKERWLPYQRWLGVLRENDRILTFNYDRVVELLEPRVRDSIWGVKVRGVETPDVDLDEAHAAKLPLLYKLHGSVNWNEQNGRVSELEWTPSLLRETHNLAIATPGDTKMQMAGGIFGRLWAEAADALQEADDVFIVGFRFPESDAFPRDRLLRALQQNQNKSLNIHVVLGPQQSADLERVLALLQWTTHTKPTRGEIGDFASRRLISHPLWAEDFLAVWSSLEAKRQNS